MTLLEVCHLVFLFIQDGSKVQNYGIHNQVGRELHSRSKTRSKFFVERNKKTVIFIAAKEDFI